MNTMNMPIVDFYSEKKPDTSGRTLGKVLSWSYQELETTHDYIQWLFPLPEPSQYNQLAPLLDAEQIARFHTDAELRRQLIVSFDMMLGFYGFERNGMSIVRSNLWEERSRNWLKSGNHNHLRLTRILKSCSILGLKDYAQAFLDALIVVFKENANLISNTTMGYWQRALLEQ